MKFFIKHSIYLFILLPVFTFAQTWDLQKNIGGTGSESVNALTVTNDKSIYIAGSFTKNFQFGNEQLSSRGAADVYLAKLNRAGEVQWSRHGGSTDGDISTKIISDNQNNIYWTGSYALSAQFDTLQLNLQKGSKAVFFIKYNPQGELLWAKSIEATGLKLVTGMAVDDEDNIFLTGYFGGSLFIDDNIINAKGDLDVFVAKFNSSGTLLWINQIGQEGEFKSVDMVLTSNDNIVIAGVYQGEATFANDTIKTNTSDNDVFIAKLNAQGEVLWGRKAGGVYEDDCQALALDEEDNIYVTGSFLAVLKISDSLQLQTWGFDQDIYLLKYNSDGDLQYGKSFQSPERDETANDILIQNNAIFLVGYFQQELDLDQLSLKGELGFYNSFVASFSLEGKPYWSKVISGDALVLADQLVSFSNDELMITGSFQTTANFDNESISSNGAYDGFLAGLKEITTSSNNVLPKLNSVKVFPNPTSNTIHIDTPLDYATIQILDLTGREIFTTTRSNSIDLSMLSNNVYVLQLRDERGVVLVRKKIVVQ